MTAAWQDRVRLFFLWIIALVIGLALCLAYQIRQPVSVRIGAPGDYHYLGGFSYPEQTGQDTWRWTGRRASITLPGLGSGAPIRLRLALHGWRPDTIPSPTVTLTVNSRIITTFAPGATLAAHEFVLPPQATLASTDLAIQLHASNVFTPS